MAFKSYYRFLQYCLPTLRLRRRVRHIIFSAHSKTNVFSNQFLFSNICSKSTCPIMCAGSYVYLWADGEKVIDPERLSAPDYAKTLFEWIESKVNDEMIFPIEVGAQFPKDFLDIAKIILKKLLRIYGHILRSHFEAVCKINLDKCIVHSFGRLAFFVLQHKLVKTKDLLPLRDLLARWMRRSTPSVKRLGSIRMFGSKYNLRGDTKLRSRNKSYYTCSGMRFEDEHCLKEGKLAKINSSMGTDSIATPILSEFATRLSTSARGISSITCRESDDVRMRRVTTPIDKNHKSTTKRVSTPLGQKSTTFICRRGRAASDSSGYSVATADITHI